MDEKAKKTARNADIFRKFLQKEKRPFTEGELKDYKVFRGRVKVDCVVYREFEWMVLAGEDMLHILVELPGTVIPQNQAGVFEYVSRVNCAMKVGRFVVDLKTRSIRVAHEIHSDLLKGRKCAKHLDELMSLPVRALACHAIPLAAMLMGLLSPEAACEAANGKNGEKADASERESAETSEPETPRERPGEVSGAFAAAPTKDYSLDGLNVEGPVQPSGIVAAVKRFQGAFRAKDVDAPRLNILLTGVPGAGKSEFVKYLGAQTGLRVRTVRASDLVRPLAGETEQRLAAAFREAKRRGEILFLDEIDSFLMDRRGASHAWEVSQVNELLQQMESFGGVLVGATNCLERLDPAVIRRFTFKLTFGYLDAAGKELFFNRYFKTPLTAEESRRLAAIERLAPGDFRTVRQGLYYLEGKPTNDARLSALEAESRAKGGTSAPRIGFA